MAGQQILVVDDEEDLLELVDNLLEPENSPLSPLTLSTQAIQKYHTIIYSSILKLDFLSFDSLRITAQLCIVRKLGKCGFQISLCFSVS